MADGPSEAEIQRDLITGLPEYINEYCKPDKANLLESLKSFRFKLDHQELINIERVSYKTIRIYGTIYWTYSNQKNHRDPAAGQQLNTVMTNSPDLTHDHTSKWDFLAFGPWSQLLNENFEHGCQNF